MLMLHNKQEKGKSNKYARYSEPPQSRPQPTGEHHASERTQ